MKKMVFEIFWFSDKTNKKAYILYWEVKNNYEKDLRGYLLR